jgi:uncharacterized repeat protein (TIGR03943 family)
LLAGSLVSGFIEVFLKRATLLRFAPRRAIPAALMGASLGMVFPVCECGVGRLSSAMAPRESRIASSSREKNLLDWLMAFDGNADPAAFDGQEAKLTGFVYRDSRHGYDSFMLSRFVVSCCVADATPIGLIVHGPEAAELANDQWVEVAGHFEAGEFDGRAMPLLIADTITPTVMPNQPYLFP